MENNLIKEEWIDGEVMMSPRPQFNHMQIEGFLYNELQSYFKGKCIVALESSLFLTKANPSEVKTDFLKLKELTTGKKAELVPDIAVYCDKEQIIRRGFIGVPQLIVEILSPGNPDDDTETKKEIYRKFGVNEYWIVSPMSKKVYVYYLEQDSYTLYCEYNFLEKEIKSNRFEDLVVDIREIMLFTDDEEY